MCRTGMALDVSMSRRFRDDFEVACALHAPSSNRATRVRRASGCDQQMSWCAQGISLTSKSAEMPVGRRFHHQEDKMQKKKITAIWCTALTLLAAGACSSSDDVDGDDMGNGDGDGDTGGTGGASGGISSTGGAEPTGGANPTGGAGPSTGGMFGTGGGMGGVPDICGDSAPTLTESQTTYANFEGLSTDDDPPVFQIETAEAGVYWYDDASGSGAERDFVAGVEGDQALHVGYLPAAWGAGAGFYSTCVDASVFDGISFWARGEMPEGSSLQVELHVPETTTADSASGTGACPGAPGVDCLPNKAQQPQITDEWVQYFFTWDQFTGGSNRGAPVELDTTRLNGLNFHVPGTAGTIDLSVDDVQFFIDDGGMGGAGGEGGG